VAGDVEGGLALRRGDDVGATRAHLHHLRQHTQEKRHDDLGKQRGHHGVSEHEDLGEETAPVR
jgi:hypothetical protein|tara:strand:+ start:380 stop:568 length:189 start_codon:yes stop_codon:yes gene_type:complete